MLKIRNSGIIITGELLAAGIFFILVGIFSFDFFSAYKADTSILIEPRARHFNLENTVIIDVSVVSRTPINAVDVVFTFPTEHLHATAIEKNEDVFDLWVVEPAFSNTDGHVFFTGGTTRLGGVVGKIHIASIMFEPLKAGDVSLDFSHSLVLAHDGEGTDLGEESINAAFIVESLEKKEAENVSRVHGTSQYVIKEKEPPSPDINNDGDYSIKDLSAFLSRMSGDYNEENDLNQDGKVGAKDASIIFSKIFTGD